MYADPAGHPFCLCVGLERPSVGMRGFELRISGPPAQNRSYRLVGAHPGTSPLTCRKARHALDPSPSVAAERWESVTIL